MIDNRSAHGSKEVLPELQNIEIYVLSPRTTSLIQPLHAGKIDTVKGKFRRRILFRVFENIDACRKSIYNIDILTVMRWATEDWNSSSPK